MKLINKNTDYAVRALLHLADQNFRFVSSREIAVENEIPLRYIRRILQELCQQKILLSKEGANGGVKLLKAPGQIALLDLIRAFQGEVTISECLFRKDLCRNRKTCVLRKQIQRIEHKLSDEFQGITIQSLIKDFQKVRFCGQ